MPSLLATLGNKLFARSRHRRRAAAMTMESQTAHAETEPVGVIAPELATTSTPSLPSMSFPPQHFTESLLSSSSFSSSSSSATSTSIPQLLQSVSPTEEASVTPLPLTSLSAKSSVSSFSSSPPPDRPPPPPPRPLFSSVTFLNLSSPIPQPAASVDTIVSPSAPSSSSPTELQTTTPVSPLISSATARKDISPIEGSQAVSASFSATSPSSVPVLSPFRFKSRRTRQTKLSTPQTPSPVAPTVQPTEESAPAPTQKRTFLAFRVKKKKTLKQADLPPATPTRTRLSLLHAPSHSQSPLPSHSHSVIPPHSSNTREPSSPSIQTVTQSSFSHFSTNSFKTSIRSHTTNLFSFKRFRRAPRPSFSSDRDFKTDRHSVDQRQQQQQPQQKRRISLRDPKRPAVDQDVAMQKVEYMSELYSGSMTSFDMAPGATGTGVGERQEEENSMFMSGSSAHPPHRQTLSSKRMRPPLAEISTAQAHPPSPSPSPSFSSPTAVSKIEGVSCSNGGGHIYNRPALILHNSNGNSSNSGHITHPIDSTKTHILTTSNDSNGNGMNNCSFNATPVGASSAAVSTLHQSLVVNNSKNNKNNNGSIHYSIDTCNTSNTYNSNGNSNNSNINTTVNNIQLNNNTERVRLAASAGSEAEDHAHHPSAQSEATTASSTPRQGRKRTTSRGQLSKDAKHIKMRIRKLWQDPRLPEHHQERRDPKNQYILVEEALTGILQIVPPIIQNARSSPNNPVGPGGLPQPPLPALLPNVIEVVEDQQPSPASYAHSAAQATEASAATTPSSLASFSSTGPGAIPPFAGSAIQGSSRSTPSTPIRHTHARARTTSANSTSTISATRFQIATNMLQPPEPELTDVTQSAIRPMASMAGSSLLGEPSLITIMASATASSSLSSNAAAGGGNSGGALLSTASTAESFIFTDHRHHVWDSNEILIAKLSSLCNTLKSAIRTLCEQQNEKVLRFDDFMIMSLLKRWEQDAAAAAEAGKDEEDTDSNAATSAAMTQTAATGRLGSLPNNGSTTSLVSLGATNALENYQMLVARVWEETDVILACIRKIRDLVEFGRVHHYNDFDDDDSEEDAVEKDEIARNGLYSTLFAHAERLVTTLGEFLECASGILRLVGTIKKHQRASLKGEKRPREREQEHTGATSPLSASSSSSSSSSPAVGPYSGLFLSSPTNQPASMAGFMAEEPRPIKHLDPALMRKLKRKTPRLKAMAEKVRKTVSEFKKKSTNSILTIFPPLGDGTNEGFHWDSYSDDDYASEEWIASDMASSNWGLGTGDSGGGQDYGRLQLTPPVSPEILTEGAGYFYGGGSPPPQPKHRRHRRVGSKDSLSPSVGRGDQYWPGSTPIVEGVTSAGLAEEGFSNAIKNNTAISPFSLTPPLGLRSKPLLVRTNSQDMSMSRSQSADRRVETLGIAAAPGPAGDTPSLAYASKQALESVREVPVPVPATRPSVYLASSLPDYSQPLRSPTKPTTEGSEKRQSFLFRRRGSQTPAFTGASISSPIPVTSRPFSVHSSGSETQNSNNATSPTTATTPSRNNYKARPPKPPGPISAGGSTALPPFPPSPSHSYFKTDELIQETSNLRDAAGDRNNSYLASRSVSPLQTTPLILDSPFTRQTSIRMGHDRNRYSIRMPADDVAGVVGLGVTGADSHSNSNSHPSAHSTPSPSSLSFSSVFWRRRSFNDSLEKSWQAFKRESVLSEHSIQSTASSNLSQLPQTERSGNGSGNGSGIGSGSGSNNSHTESSIRLTSFEFLIPFFTREGSHTGSLKSFSSRKSRATGSAIAVNTAGLLSTGSGSSVTSPVSLSPSLSRSQLLMMDRTNRRHSSPLLASSEEKMLAEALAIPLQQSPKQGSVAFISPQRPHQQLESLDQSSSPVTSQSAAVAQHRTQDHQEAEPKRPELPSTTSTSLFTYYNAQAKEIHPLDTAGGASSGNDSSPLEKRPKLIQQTSFQQDSAGRTMIRKGKEAAPSQQGGKDGSGVQAVTETKRPVSGSRFSDMKKAWEILSMDVKRLNHYSHLRAYAKTYNPQTNQWAHSQPPSATKSTASPQVLNFGENGMDVLVMEIVNGEHLQVVAGLLEKLIERLADENVQDGEYVSCFVLSHAFFIDSEDLLARLMARFHIQPRQGEILYFEKWQTVIQVKILCVLQRWVQIQYEDFELNPALLKTLKTFLEFDVRSAGFRLEAEFIEQNIFARSLSPIKNCSVIMEQGLFCLQRSRTRKLSLTRAQNRSLGATSGQPALSPASNSPHEALSQAPTEQLIEYGPTPELEADSPIRELDAQDLARYLTLADMKAFRSITVFELMTGWWKRRRSQESKKEAAEAKRDSKSPSTAPMNVDADGDSTIEAFTRRANMLSYWVAHEIVSCKQPKHRKQLIRKFIEVAMKCRELNNLHTTMFIVSALTSTPVTRLYKTWKLVSPRDKETLRGLETLLDPSSNMRHYRQAIAEATAPTIPFLPILLKDITFILDGNPTMIASQASVNSTSGTSAPKSAGTNPVTSTATPGSGSNGKSGGAMLVNFDKFRRLTQYVEHAVDMAKSVDYWFEPQLLRQARVFRPSSINDNESQHGSLHGPSSRPRSNSNSGMGSSISNNNGLMSNVSASNNNSSRGALDNISEIVERRLVKASGLYGAHQRVIEVEFSTRPKPPTSLWKASVAGMTASVGGGSSSNTQGTGGAGGGYGLGGLSGSGGGSLHGAGQQETVIRAVQGEEEYLMGLSLLCESH